MRRLTAVSAVENISPWQAGGEETARESTELLVKTEEQWNGMLPEIGSKLNLDVINLPLGVVDEKAEKVASCDADVLACFVLEPDNNRLLLQIGLMVAQQRISTAVIFSIMGMPKDDRLIRHINTGLQAEIDHESSKLIDIPSGKMTTNIDPIVVHPIIEVWRVANENRTLGIVLDIFDRARLRKQQILNRN